MATVDDYERRLQADKYNLAASQQLERIYRQRANWIKLTELLLARIEFPSNTQQQRVDLYQNIARIYEDNMHDRESAFVVLQAAFREDNSNGAVLHELERLAQIAGKWDDLLGEYTQTVNQILDPKERANRWVKIGQCYAKYLDRIDYGIASLQKALAIDPNHDEALTHLAEYYRKTQQWRELEIVLAHHSKVNKGSKK